MVSSQNDGPFLGNPNIWGRLVILKPKNSSWGTQNIMDRLIILNPKKDHNSENGPYPRSRDMAAAYSFGVRLWGLGVELPVSRHGRLSAAS